MNELIEKCVTDVAEIMSDYFGSGMYDEGEEQLSEVLTTVKDNNIISEFKIALIDRIECDGDWEMSDIPTINESSEKVFGYKLITQSLS